MNYYFLFYYSFNRRHMYIAQAHSKECAKEDFIKNFKINSPHHVVVTDLRIVNDFRGSQLF